MEDRIVLDGLVRFTRLVYQGHIIVLTWWWVILTARRGCHLLDWDEEDCS